MPEPRVPGDDAPSSALELPCGESVDVKDLDMGVRDISCACGGTHAVVQDVHPPSRFFPESLVAVLQETIEPEDDFDEFDTIHLMGVVLEEFPEDVAVKDVSDDGSVGYSMVWVTEFDSRRLHEIVVELIVELMEHAVSHAEDQNAVEEFERQMLEFDVAEFVEAYRADRDFADEHDTAL
ncbi:DUF5815 family protein [Halorubellus salinus]|uniref:DUF5815 family protein n=1 Tax=Halorubellus salinus TaxID=755309 RepID=UPI001D07F394|nr:DUF5815 family protein [Halorubellus salinus]